MTGTGPTLTRILQVDDDEDILTIGETALEGYGGFDVRTAVGGMEGLKAAAEFKPQLILLDCMMPGMDGPQFLEAVRKLPGGDTVEVVFMTASVSAERRVALLASGALDVLPKPFDVRTLSQQILKIWNDRHA